VTPTVFGVIIGSRLSSAAAPPRSKVAIVVLISV
jgi:hypothetical protein